MSKGRMGTMLGQNRGLRSPIPSMFPGFRVGRYYCSNPCLPWLIYINPPANRLRAFPFVASRRIRVDRLGFWLQADGAAGARARLGIYRDNGNVYPGRLIPLTDVAELLCDQGDSPIWRENTIDRWLDRELHWFAILYNDATIDVQQITNVVGYAKPPILGSGVGGGQADSQVWHAQAYGPLPETFPTAAPTFSSFLWNIMVRIAEVGV